MIYEAATYVELGLGRRNFEMSIQGIAVLVG